MFNKFSPENRAVYEILWKNTGHRWQYNTKHAFSMMDH